MEKTYICGKHKNLQLAFKSGMAKFRNGRLTTDDKEMQKEIEAHNWYGSKIQEWVSRPTVQNNQEGKTSTEAGVSRHPKPFAPPRSVGAPPKHIRDAAMKKAMEALNEHTIDKGRKYLPSRSEVERASKRLLLDIAEEWDVYVPEGHSNRAIRNFLEEAFEKRWAGQKKRKTTLHNQSKDKIRYKQRIRDKKRKVKKEEQLAAHKERMRIRRQEMKERGEQKAKEKAEWIEKMKKEGKWG